MMIGTRLVPQSYCFLLRLFEFQSVIPLDNTTSMNGRTCATAQDILRHWRMLIYTQLPVDIRKNVNQ